MSTAPDMKHVVREVDTAFPYLLQHNTHEAGGEFLQRVIERLNGGPVAVDAGDWSHIHKSAGEGAVDLPNGERVSHDVIWHRPTRRQIDIISAGGNHPVPGGAAWQEIDPAVYRSSNAPVGPWPVMPVMSPTTATKRIAKLGHGWFCMPRAFADWPERAMANKRYIDEHLAPEFWRVFVDLEGTRHMQGGSDVWSKAGGNIFDTRHQDNLKRVRDLVGADSQRLSLTMFGGDGHAATRDQFNRASDILVSIFTGHWDVVYRIEGANEYNINGFSERQVQEIVRALHERVPSTIPLACSSPALAHGLVEVGGQWMEPTNEQMGDSIEALYGPVRSLVKHMTVHVSRGSEKWGDPFSYNPYMTELKKSQHEPRGQGASAGGDVVDPNVIARDYQHTCDAGWVDYITHNRWAVWNGELPEPWASSGRFPEKNIWEHENILETFQKLRAIRYGSVVIPPKGPTVPMPTLPKEWLLPGEELRPGDEITSADKRVVLAYQRDGNLVLYDMERPSNDRAIWSTPTAGHEPDAVAMQGDGNLVMYDKAGSSPWDSKTAGHPGAKLLVQNDGNVVLYEGDTAIWSTGTQR